MVEPVYREFITRTNSSIYYKKHEIHFKTKYFKKKSTFRSKKAQPVHEMGPPFPVCIAASMHLNIGCPPDVAVVSPICFISCRSQQPCRATIQIPHAISLSGSKKDLFILTTHYSKPSLVSSPVERYFEIVKVDSLDVGKRNVTFKTTITEPSLYAIGIRYGGGMAGGVAGPHVHVPLECVLCCLCAKYDNQTLLPVKIYVGLNLPTVLLVHNVCVCVGGGGGGRLTERKVGYERSEVGAYRCRNKFSFWGVLILFCETP